MHISSSYAKILGEKLFHTWKIPRSGSKAKDGKEEREEINRKVGYNNGQVMHGARKHAWRTQAAWANCMSLWSIRSCYIEIIKNNTFVMYNIGKLVSFVNF